MMRFRLFRVVILVLSAVFAAHGADNGFVAVTKDVAKVLYMPYGDARTLGMARKGDRLKVVSKNGEWFNVEFRGGHGWIFQANVEPIDGPPPPSLLSRPNQNPPSVSPQQQQQTSAASPSQENPPSASRNAAAAEPAKPQASADQPVSRPDEKTSPAVEQAEKKYSRKHSKQPQQNPTVDLPPAQVTPIVGTKELSAYPSDSSNLSGRSARTGEAVKVSSEKPSEKQQTGTLPTDQQKNGQKYFEITESPAKVLVSVSPESPILGIARNSECYPVLYMGTSWCKIQFGNSAGWIDRRYGRIVDAPTSAADIQRIVLYASLGGVAVILLALLIVLIVISLRSKSARKVAVKKDLLIIAKSEKQIQYSLTDATTTLSKCFSEIGFQIQTTSSFERATNLLAHYDPDVIVVDWQVDPRALPHMESIFANRRSPGDTLVVFYNVPDAEIMRKPDAFPNAHFLGIAFSDRDIFKLVTPIIISKSGAKAIRKSVETSALGGEIGQGSLIEVMQFIEIGRKTGCLYVVFDRPFGLIYFVQGRLSYAATQTQQGRDAVFELLNLKKGHFHFVLDKTSQTTNVDLSTLEILMEWTKTVDEAHRH
jgi:hypothetical protein